MLLSLHLLLTAELTGCRGRGERKKKKTYHRRSCSHKQIGQRPALILHVQNVQCAVCVSVNRLASTIFEGPIKTAQGCIHFITWALDNLRPIKPATCYGEGALEVNIWRLWYRAWNEMSPASSLLTACLLVCLPFTVYGTEENGTGT